MRRKGKKPKVHVPARVNVDVIEKARKRADHLEMSLTSYIEKAIKIMNDGVLF